MDFLATLHPTEKYATSRDEPDSSEIGGKSQVRRVDFMRLNRRFHLSAAIVMHV